MTIQNNSLDDEATREGAVDAVRGADWPLTLLGSSDEQAPGLWSALHFCWHSSTAGCVLWGGDLRFFPNVAWSSLFGAGTFPLGRPLREVQQDVSSALGSSLDDVFREGASLSLPDFRVIVERDGVIQAMYASLTCSPLCGESGDVEGVFVVAHETTETVRDQVEARAHEDALARQVRAEWIRLRQVIDAMPVGVVIAGPDGRYEWTNNVATSIIGQQAAGRPLPRTDNDAYDTYGLRHDDGSPVYGNDVALQRSLRGEVIEGEQNVLRNPLTERDVPILVNSTPLFDVNGAINGALAVIQDISAFKDLERQKNEFLSAAAHDLKNPLTSILGITQLLQHRATRLDSVQGQKIIDGLSTIERAARMMTEQIAGLLDGARLHMERPLDLDLHDHDLVVMLPDLLREYEQSNPHHQLRFDADQAVVSMQCDWPRLRRALANLLSNAVKYSPNGGLIVVSLASRKTDDGGAAVVEISVTDQGIGIPDDDLPHIFDRFYRASNVNSIGGTGLGLAGVRQVVLQHDGSIVIASNVDAGTTATLTLRCDGPRHGSVGIK